MRQLMISLLGSFNLTAWLSQTRFTEVQTKPFSPPGSLRYSHYHKKAPCNRFKIWPEQRNISWQTFLIENSSSLDRCVLAKFSLESSKSEPFNDKSMNPSYALCTWCQPGLYKCRSGMESPPQQQQQRLANHLPGRTWGPSRWGGACLVGRIRPFEGRLSRPPRRGCYHDPVTSMWQGYWGNLRWTWQYPTEFFHALNFGVGAGTWIMNDKPLPSSHFLCWGGRNWNKFGVEVAGLETWLYQKISERGHGLLRILAGWVSGVGKMNYFGRFD